MQKSNAQMDNTSWMMSARNHPHMQELARYLARRSGIRRLVQIGIRSVASFEIPNSPFTEHICIDLPETKNFVENYYAPSSRFIAWNCETSLTDHIPGDVFSNAVVVCSGILENLADPQIFARELASLRTRCPWLLLATPDLARVRGLLQPAVSTNCLRTMEWTADTFGRFLVDCGFSQNALIGYTINNIADRAKNSVLVVAGSQAEYIDNPHRLKIAAIINMFNEADIIESVVRHLVNQGIDVHLVDNWSNDGSYEIGQDFVAQGLCANISRFPDSPSKDYQWALQLDHTTRYAASLDADWIIHHDADEIRLSPWPGVLLAQAIEYVDGLGYTAIDFTVINFLYTDDEATAKCQPAKFRWFDWGRQPPDFVQVKAWKNLTPVNLITSGGHEAEFDGRRVYPIKFLTKHYPMRSHLQTNRKIFQERLPRGEKERSEKNWHIQYDSFRGLKEIRHWHSFELLNFDPNIFNAEYLVERISGIGVEQEPKAILNLETADSEFRQLRSEFDSESQRLRSEFDSESQRLRNELESQRNRAAALEIVVKETSDETANLRAQLTHGLEAKTVLEAQLTDALAAKTALEKLVKDTADEATRLRAQLGETKAALQIIYMSTSWRLTVPLRRFAKKFPWFARQLKRTGNFFWRASHLRHLIQRNRNARLLASSKFFDRKWYLDQYADVRAAKANPVLHYLNHGASEGRNPGPLFDNDWYVHQNPDVRHAGINPLVHYLKHGAAEGRKPIPSHAGAGATSENCPSRS